MSIKFAKRCIGLLSALLLGFGTAADASFHLMRINEVYSNADGTVQFIEITAYSGGQQFIGGQAITTMQGTQTKSFTFPSNLPGDTAMSTNDPYDPYNPYGGSMGMIEYRSFLIGTQGFKARSPIAPDFIVPNGFVPLTNGTINYAGLDVMRYAALPTDGSKSMEPNGATPVNSPKNFAGQMATLSLVAAPLNYSDLWWAGTAEDGWGMTVQQHGNTQFNVFFVYDGTGKPIWYAMPGGTWNSDFTTFSGGLAKPTSAPLNTYDKTMFQPGMQIGTMTITYLSANTARLNYTINGVSGQKNIQRQIFGVTDNTAGLNVGDMWWAGSAQDGWGVSITQQFRTLFAAWYSYDLAGNVTWHTLPGGTWNGNTYSGVLATATSSAWLSATYDPSKFKAAAMGTVSFAFTDANNAVMSYTFTAGPFTGTTQTKALVRQPY